MASRRISAVTNRPPDFGNLSFRTFDDLHRAKASRFPQAAYLELQLDRSG
jgi:hypothetical protein